MSAPNFEGREACAGVDTEIFFPPEGLRGSDKRAKDICARCPVKQRCLDFALPRVWIHGVWGGTNNYERKQMRKRLRSVVVHPSRNEPAGHRPERAS